MINSPISISDLVRVTKDHKHLNIDPKLVGVSQAYTKYLRYLVRSGEIFEVITTFYHGPSNLWWVTVKGGRYNIPVDCLEVVFSV